MPDLRIRPVEERDLPAVRRLVRELAEYERLLDDCKLTVEQLRAALFGPAPALFCHVAVADAGPSPAGGEVVGCALWFLNFSTFRGTHGIYLEDLYVRPDHRGTGLGRALLRTLAQECVRHGYARLEWSVLDWNTPSIDFYKSLGAQPMAEWTTFRVTDAALLALGGDPDEEPDRDLGE